MIAWDTETDRIAPFVQAPPLACASFAWAGGSVLWHWSDSHLPGVLRSLLGGTSVGHGVAFDMGVIVNQFPELWPDVIEAYESDRVTCTIVRQKLIDIAEGNYRGFDYDDEGAHKLSYDLADMARRLLRRKLDKDEWRLRYGEFRNVPLSEWPEGARRYPVDDAIATRDIFDVQEVYRDEYLLDQYRQSRASFWIKLMTNWGLRTNREGIERLAYETQQGLDAVRDQLIEAGLLTPSRVTRTGSVKKAKRNTKPAAERLCAAYLAQGLTWPVTDTGRPSLNKVACDESGDPILQSYSQYTTLSNILSTDVPLLSRGMFEPIHVYCETMLETGRTSTSPNVQNVKKGFTLPRGGEYSKPDETHYRKVAGQGPWLIVPQGIRECFCPSQPGWVYVSADYSGLELCTFSQVCIDLFNFSTLADALNNGVDPHSMIGCQILGAEYAEFLVWNKTKGHPRKDDAFNARQCGKVTNFGRLGALGKTTLVFYAKNNYGVDLSVNHLGLQAEAFAQKLIDICQGTWHEIPRYFDYIDTIINRGNRPVIEHVRSWRRRGGVTFTKACNTLFQGLGADVAKAAGWYIMRECYTVPTSPLFGFRIVNFIHDEFLLEGPEARAPEAAERLSELMLHVAKQWLPDVKIKAVPMVSRLWSKKAEPVRGEDGRLKVWEPIVV